MIVRIIGGFLISLSVVIFVLTIGLISLAGPNNPAMPVLQPLLCAPGETLTVQVSGQLGVSRRVSIGDFHCVSATSGVRTVVTDRFFLIVGLSAGLPFILSMTFLTIDGFRRQIRKVRSLNTAMNAGRIDQQPAPGASPDLTAKLQELQKAYNAGFLTREEFNSKREELLKKF